VFQYGINSLTKAIDAFRNGQENDSVLDTMIKARDFMRLVDGDGIPTDVGAREDSREDYVMHSRSEGGDHGMQILLRCVEDLVDSLT